MNTQNTVLIVGGLVRPIVLDRIRSVLADVAVEWTPTRESDPSCYAFASHIRRPEVRLVVILHGVSRHQHVRDALRLARLLGKKVLNLHRSPNVQSIRVALSAPAVPVGANRSTPCEQRQPAPKWPVMKGGRA